MNRINKATVLITVLIAIGVPCYGLSKGTAQLNVLLIMVDDLGYADLSCYGSTDMRTPHLAYNAPHFPVQPPEEWLAKVKTREEGITEVRAKMVAFVEHLDDSIGKVLKAVDDLGVRDNTIVFFTSDNGGLVRVGSSNGSLRAGKTQWIRIKSLAGEPCVVRAHFEATPQAFGNRTFRLTPKGRHTWEIDLQKGEEVVLRQDGQGDVVLSPQQAPDAEWNYYGINRNGKTEAEYQGIVEKSVLKKEETHGLQSPVSQGSNQL